MLRSEADDLLAEIQKSHNQLRARLATFIESWDVGNKRERAMISLMKQLSYDAEDTLKAKLHDLT